MRGWYLFPAWAMMACTFSSSTPDAVSENRTDGRVVDGSIPPDASGPPRDAGPDAAPITTSYMVIGDTFISKAVPSTGFPTQASALVEAGDNECTALLKFDLSTLPTQTTILAGSLILYSHEDNGKDVDIYPVLEEWVETQANWNSRSLGLVWSAPGANPPSRGEVSLGRVRADESFHRYEITLNAATLNSVVGHLHKGLALVTRDNDGVRFVTRDFGTPSMQPVLRLTHAP